MKNSKLILLIISIFFFGNSFSQTKWIFHKSHSGSNHSLKMDENNNFGPGMAPIRYRTPFSKVNLKYIPYQSNRYNFPVVILDTTSKTMRFFDTKDSLIGCDRDYREYVREGTIVYNIRTNSLFIYQRVRELGGKKVHVRAFLALADSNLAKYPRSTIVSRNNHILDGNNHRIKTIYSVLNWKLTRILLPPTFEEVHKGVIPVKLNIKKIRREDKRLEREERKQIKRDLKEIEKRPKLEKVEEEENLIPIFNPTNLTPKTPSKLPFLFVGLLLVITFVFGTRKVLKSAVLKV